MDANRCTTHQGFRLRSILIYSLWITALGILLFRLATANTQQNNLFYVRLFSISGVTLATAPWISLLLFSTTIMVLYHAGIFDFTWLIRSSVETRREAGEDVQRERAKIWKRFAFRGEASRRPKLLRNRTI